MMRVGVFALIIIVIFAVFVGFSVVESQDGVGRETQGRPSDVDASYEVDIEHSVSFDGPSEKDPDPGMTRRKVHHMDSKDRSGEELFDSASGADPAYFPPSEINEESEILGVSD